MTRKDIVSQLVRRTDLTTSQATHAVEGIIDIIADTLVMGKPILLRGFGTIKTVQRAAKPAFDIPRMKNIMLPPCKRVKFIAYNELQERINRADKETRK